MDIIVTKDYDELSRRAFEMMKEVVLRKPSAVLGLATGSTPLGLYRLMAEDHERAGTSYRLAHTVNLDEYVGLGAEHEQSYAYFMRKNLFSKIGIPTENTNLPNGLAPDEEGECARYNALLSLLHRDIQLLGIGSNGHIAFNEPGTPFSSETHVVSLAESTVRDNSRLFAREEDVPRRAYTMGLKNIMDAGKILILANGANKAQAVRGMVRGEISEGLPASILRLHADCVLIADEAAASLL